MRNRTCWILGLTVLVSCAGGPARVDRVSENGVEIVLNHVEPYRLRGHPSTFDLEKVLAIDLERDDLAAAGVGSVGEWGADDQGNIYVVGFKNNGNFVHKFDARGRLLLSFGRRGQGPGELQWPFLAGVSESGEVSIADYAQKFIVYDSSGQTLREIKLMRRALNVKPLANGKYLVFGSSFETSPDGKTYTDALTLCDGKFNDLRVLDRHQADMENSRQVPFFMWRVSGNRIIVANQARGYELWVYDLDGNLVRKIRKEYRPVRVTEAIKEAILGPEYRRSGVPQNKYFSDPLPPLNQFFSDDEGRIFVMTYETGRNAGEYVWDIFNPDGVFIGRKALNIQWASLYLGPLYTFVKKGLLYCHRERESGFDELAVYRMAWK